MKNYLVISPYIRLIDSLLEELKQDNELLVKFDLDEDSIDAVLEEAHYRTLFDDKKIILVKNYNQNADEDLLAYLNKPHSDVSIIIWTNKKLDERKKHTKELKSKLEVIDYSNIDESNLISLLKKYFENSKRKIDLSSIKLLIQRCINNYDLIINESQKLLLNCEDLITKEDIEIYVSEYIEDNIFNIKETIIKKDTIKALEQFELFVLNKEEVFPLISMLEKEYRLIYITKNSTYNDYDLSKMLKIHSYPIKLARDNSKLYSTKELENILVYLSNLDIKIKSGKVNKNDGFRQFIVYSGGQNE